MSHRVSYFVGYDSFRNRWRVRREKKEVGSSKTKKEAVKMARKKAKDNKPSELVVANKAGTKATEETAYGEAMI